MMYSSDIIEQVRSANDIVDVVGSYVRLNHRGSNYVGLCPFHNEKTGSFSVNKNMQIYKCFGCGKAGNVFTFLMDYDNLTFTEALKELAGRVGIALPEIEMTEEEKQKRHIKEKLLDVNKDVATYYYVKLRTDEGKHAYDYLSGRALSDETIKNFGLGFAGIHSNDLYGYLKSKGYSDDILKESGLFSFSEKGVSDKFWNRVMFPIMDRNGKVIAFGGRIMGSAENAPKYLNSPETKVFYKGENLYGLHLAKHSRKSYFLLCEGYMDVIALHQAGFSNAVASLGTALTPKQAKLIHNYVHEVVITYDSDDAGKKAALRAIPILKEAGITTKVVNMKPYKDPDEFIKNLGAEEYEKRITEARAAFFFEAETMRESIDADNPAEKTTFDHELARKLARITDEIERNNYIESASRKYNIDHGSLTRLVNRYGREELATAIAEETMQRDREQRKRVLNAQTADKRAEENVICYVANNKAYFDHAVKMIDKEDFTNPLCNRLWTIISDLYNEGINIVHASIINNFTDVTEQEQVAGILDASLYEIDTEENERRKSFTDQMIRLKENRLEAERKAAIEADDAAALLQVLNREKELDKLRLSEWRM